MTTHPPMLSVETLAQLLRDAEQAHGAYERRLGRRDDDWPAWYARHMLGPLQQFLAGGARTPATDAAAPVAGAS